MSFAPLELPWLENTIPGGLFGSHAGSLLSGPEFSLQTLSVATERWPDGDTNMQKFLLFPSPGTIAVIATLSRNGGLLASAWMLPPAELPLIGLNQLTVVIE